MYKIVNVQKGQMRRRVSEILSEWFTKDEQNFSKQKHWRDSCG